MRQLTYILLLVTATLATRAQSVHYSQYNDFVSMLNPAAVGASSDYDYIVGVLNRTQWRQIPARYNTFAANADFSLYLGDKYENGWFGLGASFINDVAGDGNLKNQRMQGAIAYHQKINDRHILSVGFSGGIDQLSLDFSALTYATQWNGGTYDPTLPNGEAINSDNLQYSYLNSGLHYSFLSEAVSIKVGYGLQNINKPIATFLGTYSPIAMRHLLTTEAAIQVGDQVIVRPRINYTYQAKAHETIIGAGVHYNLDKTNKQSHVLFTGLNFRLGDAMVPYFGYEENNWKVVISYEATVSDLAPYNASQGALELGLVIHSTYPRGNSMKEKLICPRF